MPSRGVESLCMPPIDDHEPGFVSVEYGWSFFWGIAKEPNLIKTTTTGESAFADGRNRRGYFHGACQSAAHGERFRPNRLQEGREGQRSGIQYLTLECPVSDSGHWESVDEMRDDDPVSSP